MKKILFTFLLTFYINGNAADKDYSYSYIELGINQTDEIGYQGELSLNLPSLPIYLKGLIKDEKVESNNSSYDKTGTTLAIGVHTSLSDIFNGVSMRGLTFDFEKILELYAEIGFNIWELEDESTIAEDGTDAYARAGLKIGSASAWEYDLFVEKTKLAEVALDPITNKNKYTFSDQTNNNIGIKIINHLGESASYSLGYNNDDFSGSSFSLGFRYNF